mgnify:CR=1 FL=1
MYHTQRRTTSGAARDALWYNGAKLAPEILMDHKRSRGVQALRDAGYKLTTPRLVILDILEGSEGHITAADLLTKVEARNPSIGRASVFRTLELMVKLGIIWPTVQGGSTVHYMLMPSGHHHHFVCTRCNTLIEFEDCVLGALIHALEAQYGVHIEGHLLELYGICRACRERAATNSPNDN